MTETKICKKCLQEKPLDEFYNNGHYKRQSCKTCGIDGGLKHYHSPENHERILERRAELKKRYSKRWHKNNNLKAKYGITLDDYERMLTEQNFVCAICNNPEDVQHKVLAVDHNHETSKVRGLLCYRCNTSLGLLRENIDNVKRMLKYLEKHQ